MNREKQILNYHLCEQLKDQNIKMAKLVDKLVNLTIHKAWEEKAFEPQKHILQNALTDLMSAQSSFNKVVGQVDWLIKGHKSAERRKEEELRLMKSKTCADCGCLSNYKGNSEVKYYDRGETEYGRFRIGFSLCDDCYNKTCKNFSDDYEEDRPFWRFEKV